MNNYPRHIRWRSIRPEVRTCRKCGNALAGDAKSSVLALAPGKYLCYQCEEDRENMRVYGVKDRELIERIKKYSMDYEGEQA